MVVLTRWKSLLNPRRPEYLASREFGWKKKRMRKSGSLFFLFRNCCEKAEMRVGNMRGVESLTLRQRRQQRWCGEEFGHLRKNLGTSGFAFGYLHIFIWVPTDFRYCCPFLDRPGGIMISFLFCFACYSTWPPCPFETLLLLENAQLSFQLHKSRVVFFLYFLLLI